MKRIFIFSCVVLSLLMASTIVCPAQDTADNTLEKKELQIVRVTPGGNDVPPGRQIVIQFNRPVVPLGRMERSSEEIPVEITPRLDCKWRWLNTSALSCQLDQKSALSPATHYEVIIKPGITAKDGATTIKPLVHSFITQRPLIRHAWLSVWKSPGMPVFRVTFNQPVAQDSVERHIYFFSQEAEGEHFKSRVEPDPEEKDKAHIILLGGEKYNYESIATPSAVNDDKAGRITGIQARRVWLVSPQQELPPDTGFSLRIEPGLVSAFGPERGITNRDVVRFDTFPEFRFLGVRFRTNDNKDVLIDPDSPSASEIRCNPLDYVALVFNSPVLSSEIKANMEFTPDLSGGREDYDPWANIYSYSRLLSSHSRGQEYDVQLPETLKAWHEYQIRTKGEGIKDEFGRVLAEPINMSFFTDHRRPDFHIDYNTAVLEKQVETDVPLFVTNIEKIGLDFLAMAPKGRMAGQSVSINVPFVEDTSFAVPLGVRDMLKGESGAVYGRISSTPPVPKSEYERRFFAQITPYQVHVKAGHYNTLVWVTDLQSGRPVNNAHIIIYKDSIASLADNVRILSEAVTDKSGTAVLNGIVELDPELKAFQWGQDNDSVTRLFVRVNKDGDMALLPLDYRFFVDTSGPSSYAVYSSMKGHYGHIHAWGATAQGVYRAGDTVQYKFYVRDQDNETFVNAPRDGYVLKVIDPAGKAIHEVKGLTLSEFGAYDGEFTVSKTGAIGWYYFELSAGFTAQTWQPIRVLVSDFTPSPFRVQTELNGDLFQPGDEMVVSTNARLHAGGPYTQASTRITASIKRRAFSPGHSMLKGFWFDTAQYDTRGPLTLFQKIEQLNDQGELSSRFILPDKDIIYGRITVESAVQDDRGKYVAASTTADYIGRDRFVGLKNTEWIYYEDKPARVEFVVVDEHGVIVKDTEVRIILERLVTKVSRVKGAGNAYLPEYIDEWIFVSSHESKSGGESCVFEFVPDDAGSYRVSAEVVDTRGRTQGTQLSLWVAGKGRVVWHEPDDYSLKIIPEQESYRVGDKARYMIKNPFPNSIALITVERYGVLNRWVQTFDSSTPVIEFPVEPDYLPGFYLSVIIMSPRVDKPLGDGQVDLGKPAFRIGYALVRVKDPFKEIDIKVEPEKDAYKPGEKVKVTLHAQPRNAMENEPIELAVAVLDEAVFDLLFQGNDSFDPYKGFYHLDELDISNYSLLTRLVGRQKFEKKGASAGGDGGADLSLRSEFKFVGYWNPSLKTDDKGNAVFEFDSPDNLTSWRIFVMAVTPGDCMGLGYNSFKVNRPTEIRPVMPSQLTEGDRFKAGFSIMNRTENARELTVAIHASGAIDKEDSPASKIEKIMLPPYKRKTVYMPIRTKGFGNIEFQATAGDSKDKDGLYHLIPVNRRQSLETSINYGTSLEGDIQEEIKFPKDIHEDIGSVSVVAAPTVVGNVEGSFRYMRDYPYGCWEQKLSKAVMASHYENIRNYLPATCLWDGSDLLPEQVLSEAADFQASNGGMAYFVAKDIYVCPYLSAYTALAFNWLRKSGYRIPELVEKKLHEYLKNLLRHDAAPDYFSPGMLSTVRAVALAALSGNHLVSINDLERYLPSVPSMSLFGKSHFLLAALDMEGTEQIIKDVVTQILAHADQTGGKFTFNEELDTGYGRILATPLRSCSAILSAFTALGAKKKGDELVGDIPFKLVCTITQTRGSRDHWENTQENIFCLNALVDYIRIYEKEAPDMTVSAFIDSKAMGKTRFSGLRNAPFVFNQPITRDDPGKKRKVTIKREGKGRLYYSAGLTFAPLTPHADRTNAGMEIRREYSVSRDGKWILLSSPVQIKRGELVRVDIFLSLPGARNFVVVADPVPGGLEPVNRDLATTSVVDAEGSEEFEAAAGSWWFDLKAWHSYNDSRWCFYHQELRHDSVRFYADYLGPGNYHLSYVSQAIAAGEFVQMPVHAEELYDPDVCGKGMSGILRVTEGVVFP